jgi:hypothetical protein
LKETDLARSSNAARVRPVEPLGWSLPAGLRALFSPASMRGKKPASGSIPLLGAANTKLLRSVTSVRARFPRRFQPARRLRRGDDWQAGTGRRIHSQAAFCLEIPGIIIEVGFVEMPRRRGLAQGRDVGLEGQPEGPIDPEAIRIHGIRPADLKSAARFSTSLLRVKDFVGGSPIVAHAY